jgi:hypothetical protein
LGSEPGRSVAPTTPLERLVIVLSAFAIAIGAIAALSGFFAGQDQAGIAAAGAGPGQSFRDQGHAHLIPGAPRPAYDSEPPTSGAHVPEPVLLDQARLSVDQLLEALELGDVVVMYGGHAPPPGLTALAQRVAGRFTPALAASGQAVILAPRAGTVGLIGLAWAHMVRVSAAGDPLLGDFASFWLGRGAPRR